MTENTKHSLFLIGLGLLGGIAFGLLILFTVRAPAEAQEQDFRFEDHGEIARAHVDAVEFLALQGYMVGDARGYFHPKQSIPREQLASVVARIQRDNLISEQATIVWSGGASVGYLSDWARSQLPSQCTIYEDGSGSCHLSNDHFLQFYAYDDFTEAGQPQGTGP